MKSNTPANCCQINRYTEFTDSVLELCLLHLVATKVYALQIFAQSYVMLANIHLQRLAVVMIYNVAFRQCNKAKCLMYNTWKFGMKI